MRSDIRFEADIDALEDLARLQEIADLERLEAENGVLARQAAIEAAQQLQMPISLVSVILDGAMCFAGSQGVDGWIREAAGLPSEWSFCSHTVRTRKLFVVENATEHPVVQNSPLVRIEGVRSYAGAPLITSKGHAIGALCGVGFEPRSFDATEINWLESRANCLIQQIEQRQGRE